MLFSTWVCPISAASMYKKIRKHSSTIPVIILTVRVNEQDVVEALSEKATDYIAKPFRQMELLKRVKKHATVKKR